MHPLTACWLRLEGGKEIGRTLRNLSCCFRKLLPFLGMMKNWSALICGDHFLDKAGRVG
jgi:hypothetical protein